MAVEPLSKSPASRSSDEEHKMTGRANEADIETANVEVSGQVTGNIAATDKVELKADCKVVGDIRAPRILIADGAIFKGNVDMDVKEAKGK